MKRQISDAEKNLIISLVGNSFPDLDVIRSQLENCKISGDYFDGIIEITPISDTPLSIKNTKLGEGSYYDEDNTPVIITLLQRNGLLWRIDISKANGSDIVIPWCKADLQMLGFGCGLSLEKEF